MKLVGLVVMTLLLGCSNPDPATRGPDAMEIDAPPTVVDVSDMIPRSAAAICGALYRCCDADLALYFAPFRDNQLLAAFRDRLPPPDETSCRQVMTEMLAITPFGDWTAAVERGEVTYDSAAFATCEASLQTAACGADVRAALWDSTCLGFSPPSGGTSQRSMFRRERSAGSCGPVRDGVGAAFYGTCDPTVSFCCYQDPTRPGCQLPYDGNGNLRPGTCTAVMGIGQQCSSALPVALCATGNDCDPDTLVCVAPTDTPLAVGATCIDAGYHLLGSCQTSWCDVLGTKKCEPLRANGVTCGGGDECLSGRCNSVCVDNTVCGS